MIEWYKCIREFLIKVNINSITYVTNLVTREMFTITILSNREICIWLVIIIYIKLIIFVSKVSFLIISITIIIIF